MSSLNKAAENASSNMASINADAHKQAAAAAAAVAPASAPAAVDAPAPENPRAAAAESNRAPETEQPTPAAPAAAVAEPAPEPVSGVVADPNVLTVVVSGAAGQIGYSLLPLLANGQVFGDTKKIKLRLLEVKFPGVEDNVAGIKMELEDGGYPQLQSVEICIADTEKAFSGADVAVLTGGFPRKPGMERKDLIAKNAGIFDEQGAAIEKFASKNIKVLVIANPANTNCLILKTKASSIPAENFTALTYLDHNRARSQLALKLGVSAADVYKTCIWGNHSSTQVPDHTFGTVIMDGAAKPIGEAIGDDAWLCGEFVTTVQKRGAAIIKARQKSSAMSAANAIGDHLRTWLVTGTREGDFVSLAVPSDGSYGITKGLVFSFPVTCPGDGSYKIVQGLEITPEKKELVLASEKELLEEKAAAAEAGFL
eukprot:gene6346-13208_t